MAASLAVLLFAGHGTPFWAQWAGAMALGFGLAWTTIQIHSVALKIVVATVALLETAALAWLLQLQGIHWSPYSALAAGTLAAGFGLAYALSKAGRHRRRIEEVLGGRISRLTFQKILESDASLPFTGEMQEASVVDCRIFNRQELVGALSAPDFVALSNTFADAVAQTLMDSGGVLAGQGGEQTRALFGGVLLDPEHAAQAQEAARAVQERLQAFRQECLERWGVEADCRVSVHSGAMIVGVFGSATLNGFDVVLAAE